MQVLIVEDEPHLADAVARGLRREGMAVDVAYDGEEGFQLAVQGVYDVILLDRDLPGMSGDDICRGVVAKGLLSAVIMVSASDSAEKIRQGRELGAKDYVTKPFAFADLLRRVIAAVPQPDSPSLA